MEKRKYLKYQEIYRQTIKVNSFEKWFHFEENICFDFVLTFRLRIPQEISLGFNTNST